MYFKRLRELREDHDLKQKEVAAVLGMKQQQYARYEIGETEIPIGILIQLADYYAVSIDYIVEHNAESPQKDKGRD